MPTTAKVAPYDQAISFFVDELGFELREDTVLTDGKGWVVVSPPHGAENGLLLARAVSGRQREAISDQSGGRVFVFPKQTFLLATIMPARSRVSVLLRHPGHEPYGFVAVFEDLYGNRWDSVQPTSAGQ